MDWSRLGQATLWVFALFGALRAAVEILKHFKGVSRLDVSVKSFELTSHPYLTDIETEISPLRHADPADQARQIADSVRTKLRELGNLSGEQRINVHNAGSHTLEDVRLFLSRPQLVVSKRAGTESQVVQLPRESSSDDYPLSIGILAPGERLSVTAWLYSGPDTLRATHKAGHGRVSRPTLATGFVGFLARHDFVRMWFYTGLFWALAMVLIHILSH